jgi:hypothetical protein
MHIKDPVLVYVIEECFERSIVVRANVIVRVQSSDPCPFRTGIVSHDLNKVVT